MCEHCSFQPSHMCYSHSLFFHLPFRDCYLRLEYSVEMQFLFCSGQRNARMLLRHEQCWCEWSIYVALHWMSAVTSPATGKCFYFHTRQKGGQCWDPPLLWCKCSFVWKIFHLCRPSAWLPSRRKIFYEGIALEHDLDVIENHNSLNAITFLKWRIQTRS